MWPGADWALRAAHVDPCRVLKKKRHAAKKIRSVSGNDCLSWGFLESCCWSRLARELTGSICSHRSLKVWSLLLTTVSIYQINVLSIFFDVFLSIYRSHYATTFSCFKNNNMIHEVKDIQHSPDEYAQVFETLLMFIFNPNKRNGHHAIFAFTIWTQKDIEC